MSQHSNPGKQKLGRERGNSSAWQDEKRRGSGEQSLGAALCTFYQARGIIFFILDSRKYKKIKPVSSTPLCNSRSMKLGGFWPHSRSSTAKTLQENKQAKAKWTRADKKSHKFNYTDFFFPVSWGNLLLTRILSSFLLSNRVFLIPHQSPKNFPTIFLFLKP